MSDPVGSVGQGGESKPQVVSVGSHEPQAASSVENQGPAQHSTGTKPQREPLPSYILTPEYLEGLQDPEQAIFIRCRICALGPPLLSSPVLRSLQLRNNQICRIENIQFPRLQELELYDNKLTNIEGLDAVPELNMLDLSFNNIKRIDRLEGLTKLKKLYLLSNKIKKILNLNIPSLQMLELGSNKIERIQNLNLPNLRELFLGKNRISSIENLQHLPELRQLTLGPNKLQTISNLQVLSSTLQELYLPQNSIEWLDGLTSLVNLQVLDVSYNKLRSMRGIQRLHLLESLWLTGNRIGQEPDKPIHYHSTNMTGSHGQVLESCPPTTNQTETEAPKQQKEPNNLYMDNTSNRLQCPQLPPNRAFQTEGILQHLVLYPALELSLLLYNPLLTTLNLFSNPITKLPFYKQYLVAHLPLLDDLDGESLKTKYRVLVRPTEQSAMRPVVMK